MGALQLTLGAIGVAVSVFAWGLFAAGVVRMIRTIRLGQPDATRNGPFVPRLRQLVVEFVAHTRMAKFRSVAPWHWMVMWGFLIGSAVLFEAYGEVFHPAFHWPVIGAWPVWGLLVELLGIGTVVGGVALAVIRQLNHPRRADRLSRFAGSNFAFAYFVEAVVIIEGLGILGVKAFKLSSGLEDMPLWSSFVTLPLSHLLPANPDWVSVMAVVKLLSGMIWLIVLSRNLTMGVAWHRFSAFFNIYFKREDDGGVALGALKPMMSNGQVLDLEEADPDEDVFGVGKVEDFSWKGWLDFSTCTECGRCQSQCPAWNTGKPLSPKLVITQLRDHAFAKAPYLLAGGSRDVAGDEVGLTEDKYQDYQKRLESIDVLAMAESERPLVGGAAELGVIDPEVLWSCTTCGACVEQCPVDIEHVDHIVDMRRYQVLIESNFPSELGGMFKNLENKGNPWGQNAKDRLAWTEGLDFEVPVFDGELGDTEYLFWVGCAGAFEDRAKKTTRAVAELLHTAGVKYTVLGPEESCTGDPARRAGNEFLFQMLAQQNVEVLNTVFEGREAGQRKIVVSCAHCFNTLANEYPQVGGQFEVVHHTQLLNRLVRERRLVPVAEVAEDVTYHDPCYLGRHNKVYEAPRELVGASGATLREMPRHGDRSMCCGAGGARMWMEERIGKRINVDRVDEALGTAPSKIATGCPFCRVMLTDGVTARQNEGQAGSHVEVVDVAQLLLTAVRRGSERQDVPTDETPTGTPLPDEDKAPTQG
ncbi:(Fe-S)-binding protein [Saccharothrix algeriensis]|uniref:Fe-S oxidoreductase n=1 Tax=Saccharothrix algeriensis TaxID=173560 RepID=A0ABS2S7W8_9PSEU|nr:(Fe-S)-binding protein [Saccharothrix algeriensis]MBM7812332.1 Fe-S oxidoreductase [Saccharothrix algeriensis]